MASWRETTMPSISGREPEAEEKAKKKKKKEKERAEERK